MQIRHHEGGHAHLCIETKFFNPLWMALFVIFCLVVAIVGSVMSMFVPAQYNYDRSSLRTCCEKDVLHNPSDVAEISIDGRKDIKNNLVLIIQPESKYTTLGVNFQLQLEVNSTLGNKQVESENKTISFSCPANRACANHTLVQYHQNKYKVMFRVLFNTTTETEDETVQKTNWLNDLFYIFRSDNNNFYIAFSIYRSVAFVITLIIAIVFIVTSCRQNSKMSMEQKYTFIFLIAAIFLQDPLYLFQMGIHIGAWQVIDSIAQVIAEAYYMLYPLIVLSGFVTRRPSICGFYVPRIVLVVLYAALRLGVIIFINVESTYIDPTVQIDDFRAFQVLRLLSAIVFLFWILWFFYACARTLVVAKQHPQTIQGRFRVLIFVLVFFEVGYNGMQIVNVVFPTQLGKIGHIVTMWLGSILAIMMGVYFMPTSYDRVTTVSVAEAFQPKTKKSVKGEATDFDDEVDAAEDRRAQKGENVGKGKFVDKVDEEEEQEIVAKDDDMEVEVEAGFTGGFNDRVDD